MSLAIEDYKKLVVQFGEQFINELDEPKNYAVSVTSYDYKYMNISDEKLHYTVLSIGAPTYRELFEKVRDAWTLHLFAKRGF